MKHVEIAKKWLDGEKVQVRTPTGWVDIKPQEEFQGFANLFNDLFEYRLKPAVVYRYTNIYAGNGDKRESAGLHYNSPERANQYIDHNYTRTHILKTGSDGSAELITCHDNI